MLSPPSPSKIDDGLRYTFVEMLFALAVGQVAIYIGDLYGINSALEKKAAAGVHLLLSTILISASWVGWRKSASPGMETNISSIFSRRYLMLLIDVALVIIYFVLVRQVEMKNIGSDILLATPSAKPEAYLILTTFCLYILWDLLTDIFHGRALWAYTAFNLGKKFAVCSICLGSSILCALMSAFVSMAATKEDLYTVVALDVALLITVLFFRICKQYERSFALFFGVDAHDAFKNQRNANNLTVVGGVAMLILYVGLLLFAFR